jgi:hypothetical protein
MLAKPMDSGIFALLPPSDSLLVHDILLFSISCNLDEYPKGILAKAEVFLGDSNHYPDKRTLLELYSRSRHLRKGGLRKLTLCRLGAFGRRREGRMS